MYTIPGSALFDTESGFRLFLKRKQFHLPPAIYSKDMCQRKIQKEFDQVIEKMCEFDRDLPDKMSGEREYPYNIHGKLYTLLDG